MDLISLQKLDVVLKFINDKTQPPKSTITEIVSGIYHEIELEETVVLQILDTLKLDRYITDQTATIANIHDNRLRPDMVNVKYYLITFIGSYFIQHGGYVQKEGLRLAENDRLEKMEIAQRVSQKNMEQLTFWIAFGAIVASGYYIYYLIIPIYDHFFLKK
jgi:hypothetical protein